MWTERYPRFRDRFEAGRVLAERVRACTADPRALVLALPRGGVPVGFEVARALPAPLDVLMVRKLGVPGQEELAMGAIGPNGIQVLDAEVVDALGIDAGTIEMVSGRERKELDRREGLYRGGRPQHPIEGRSTILVDDGLATGSTMRAAVAVVKTRGAARVVVAVPVAARSTSEALELEVDEMICLFTPDPFRAVGSWYESFAQVSDEEVRDLLERAARERADSQAASGVAASR